MLEEHERLQREYETLLLAYQSLQGGGSGLVFEDLRNLDLPCSNIAINSYLEHGVFERSWREIRDGHRDGSWALWGSVGIV